MEVVVVAGRRKHAWFDLPNDGGRVRLDNYEQVARRKSKYKRWIISCARHPHCCKQRSVSFHNCSTLGALEPIAFLAAWHEVELTSEAARHVDATPSMERVRAWAELNPTFLVDNGIDA